MDNATGKLRESKRILRQWNDCGCSIIQWLNNHTFHCLRIRIDSVSFHIVLSTIDDWVTLEVHYPLWPTLWFIGLLPTITMKPSGIFLCAQHSPGPRRSWASYALTPPAFNIHWIPDVPEEAIGLSPPRSTFTESPTFPSKLLGYLPRVHSEFWHVFVRSVCWNTSKSLRWLRHHRVPCGPGSSIQTLSELGERSCQSHPRRRFFFKTRSKLSNQYKIHHLKRF